MDLNDPVQVGTVYSDYQAQGYDSVPLANQADTEMNNRLMAEFGTLDYQTILLTMAANPPVYADGRWGFSHAGVSIAELEALRLGGASNAVIANRATELLQYWGVREMMARCSDGVFQWLNPLNWGEDSRLDYWTPRRFIEWYITQL